MKLQFLILCLSISILSQISVYSQEKTNFEVVDSLIGETVLRLSEKVDKSSSYFLNFTGSDDYSVLSNMVKADLEKNGISIVDNETAAHKINYNLYEVRTDYTDLFQDGLFGNYLVERSIKLSYSFNVKSKTASTSSISWEESLTSRDTLQLSDISAVENIAYSFTSAELPEEPLLSSTLEPIIAVGTAAVAIYLFFNIRSK